MKRFRLFPFLVAIILALGLMVPASLMALPKLGKWIKKDNPSAHDGCHDPTSLKFWNSQGIVPVRFIDKDEDGVRLMARFESKHMLERMEFVLPLEREHAFYQIHGDWQEEISRQTFLKKFKNDFWLVTYLYPEEQGGDLIICNVQQVKDWEALRGSFAQDFQDMTKTIDTLAFWQNIRMKPVFFSDLSGERAKWLFLKKINEQSPPVKTDDSSGSDGIQPDIARLKDGGRVLILDRGTFSIDKNCVFFVLRVRNPLIRVGDIIGKSKMMYRQISRAYFFENVSTSLWLCSFDHTNGNLLQAVGTVSEDEFDKIKKTKDKK